MGERRQKQHVRDKGRKKHKERARHVKISMNEKARGRECEQKRGEERRRDSSEDFICSKI